MPKGSPELTQSRKKEIVAACRKLFQTMSYKEITIKEIAEETSFTRPSIYNYFETKEEIFLALFQKEYESFADELRELCQGKEKLSLKDIADRWNISLAKAYKDRDRIIRMIRESIGSEK